jgi:hypothetical protein
MIAAAVSSIEGEHYLARGLGLALNRQYDLVLVFRGVVGVDVDLDTSSNSGLLSAP